jgi:alpha-L-arabinofuranosidase
MHLFSNIINNMKSNRLKNLILVFGGLLSCIPFWSFAQETRISIDASKIENKISPLLYGSCIEDVNHEIYGGLYDQKIFGESFEEPTPGFKFDNFTAYEGYWRVEDGILAVPASAGAKLVYNTIISDNSSVETDLKFDKNSSGSAGLLVRVNNPGKGADEFDGYEISLSSDGTKIVLGKHRHNWRLINEVQVSCSPRDWNRLKVKMENQKLEIYLNGKSVLTYEDKTAPLLTGKMALRTWNADVSYRNLIIEKDQKNQTLSFTGKTGIPISNQWDAIQSADAKALFVHDVNEAYNGKCSQMIQLTTGSGTVGVSNQGLNRWGIAVTKGQQFKGRLYLKGSQLKGSVMVALQSADGEQQYAVQEFKKVSDQWEKHIFTLTSNATDPKARFAIYIQKPGKLWIDQVVLMGTGTEQFHGLPFRNDIGQAMVNEGLTFVRYGGTMVNASEYRFKKMIGDPDKRPPYNGNWYPFSTNGFGIEEFLKFCNAAKFACAFAINIDETPQDAADMIEYLNGPVTSPWGKKRADNGHPESYHLKYIEIGNEEVIGSDDRKGYENYITRFNLLYNAITSKDPSIVLIQSAWWRPQSSNMEMVFKALNGKAAYWDYHPWADNLNSGKNVEKELKQMQELFLKWDPTTNMKCAIFEENGNLHNMQRALGHVTIQNAVRRFGDFVFTSCAANGLQPYLQNDNGWDQGQVFFTPSQVWGMPPYYAQQMASENHNPLRVYSNVEGSLDVTATRDEKGSQLTVFVVNTQNHSVSANLAISGFTDIKNVKAVYLSGNLNDRNTPEQPLKIIPIKKDLQIKDGMKYDFQPYSYTILKYEK